MMPARRWRASTLALSLELAIALGLYRPANDNGQVSTHSSSRKEVAMTSARTNKKEASAICPRGAETK